MVTPEELASFLVKTAAALARLDNRLGPEDDAFRELAMGELVNEMPVPNYFPDCQEQLALGVDPVVALSQLFVRQAGSYTEAGARACSMIVDVAVLHLARAVGGDAAQRFLEDLDLHARVAEGD
ncbi:hypothetical protein GCM10009740_20960 [Terrabacter terrae]|uniref:Uncharacterized protein n=1 Tax=Terrabacter terrae TaxID=318434 RepID=A0ABN2U791_9MICO